jgi:tetratricopeptide (TPR) repeat protein
VEVYAGGGAAFDVFLHAVGGQGDDGAVETGLELGQQVDAVAVGEADVADDDIDGGELGGGFSGFGDGLGGVDLVAGAAQEERDGLERVGVVLDEEDVQRSLARTVSTHVRNPSQRRGNFSQQSQPDKDRRSKDFRVSAFIARSARGTSAIPSDPGHCLIWVAPFLPFMFGRLDSGPWFGDVRYMGVAAAGSGTNRRGATGKAWMRMGAQTSVRSATANGGARKAQTNVGKQGGKAPVPQAPKPRANWSRLRELWQMPLLVISVGLFGVAAWLFIDPKPGPTIDQQIDVARTLVAQVRPEAAIEHLNRLLAKEKLERDREAEIHLLLAESLELGQKQKKINIPENHRRIVEQTLMAMELGAKPTAAMNQRLAESYEALGRTTESLMYFRRAMMMNPERALHLQRKVIDLQLAADDPAGAAASLEDYLGRDKLADSERSWAMGEQAHLMIDRGDFAAGRQNLEEALRLNGDAVDRGQISYWLGYCEYKLGQLSNAERYLRLAREQLKVQHPLDGEAAYLLGRIAQDQKHHEEANSFFEVVLTSHPDAKVATAAKLGRGVARIALGNDDAGLTDLHDVTNFILGRDAVRRKYKADALTAMKNATQSLGERGNYQGALEVMAYEQSLVEDKENKVTGGLPASFYARLGNVYEQRADQVERNLADSTAAAEKIKREQQVRDFRAKAGDAYIGYSRALTLSDDKGYGDALWKGVELYDRAGDLQRMISALELFAAERPEDSLTPDALLRLGRAYQAAGNFDKAIAAYQRNQFRYPNTLAASKSAVPLAQAYIAKGPDFYARAERTLTGVVDNNPLVTPDAAEFRQALFELAQLHYRTGRYEDAVAKLEELTARYPKEERMGQLVFLMGDSYRKSAAALVVPTAATPGKTPEASATTAAFSRDPKGSEATKATTQPADMDPVEIANAKRDRLTKARALFDRAIETYRRTPPSGAVDKLYFKLAHFYRADCVFDLGQYEESIKLYDNAAFRYQDDPSALAAYVQIVNAYCALGKVPEAKTANERAKWLLRKMPAEAFADGGFTMPKEYWDKWLQWTSAAGMW